MAICWNIGKLVNPWAVFNLQEEAMNALWKVMLAVSILGMILFDLIRVMK